MPILWARRGIPVIGITGNARHFAARTNACRETHQVDIHNGGFLALLEQLRPSFPTGAVLFPCTDQSALLVSKNRDALAPTYRTGLADHHTMVTLADKAAFAVFAKSAGLPIPHTEVLYGYADALRAATMMTFPALLKPSVKTAQWKRGTTEKVHRVESATELLSAYRELAPWAEKLIVQEVVPGADDQLYTCNAYFDANHRPLAALVSRKVRQWPPQVGTASLARTVRNEEVIALTTQVFAAARFSGLAYLEVKFDQRSHRYLLIETNVGRPTSRSAMAEAAGVEMLGTMYADVLHHPLPRSRQQRDDVVQWVDDRRDLMAAARLLSRGELDVGRWWHTFRRPTLHAVASARDPWPFALELTQSLQKVTRRALGVRRPRSAVGQPSALRVLSAEDSPGTRATETPPLRAIS